MATTIRASAVGFTVAGAVLAVLLWLIDTGTVVAALRGADPALVAAVGATILLWNGFWGVALWNVLRALEADVGLPLAVLVNAAAAFFNHVSPVGQAGGEPATAYLLTRSIGSDYEVNLAAVASHDAINVVPSVSLAAVGAAYYATTATIDPDLRVLFAGVVAVAVSLPGVVAVAWRRRHGIERAVLGAATRVLEVADRIADAVPLLPAPPDPDVLADQLEGFLSSLAIVARNRRRLAAAVAFSAAGWGVQAVGLWLSVLAVGGSIPLVVPFFVVPLGATASVVPTPGGLGGVEVASVGLLALLTGLDAGTATAAVAIHSVGGYLLTSAVGAAAAGALGARGYR